MPPLALTYLTYLTCLASSVQVAASEQGPTYSWDQIHEVMVSHSPGTSLVIVNLPDPPELALAASLR